MINKLFRATKNSLIIVQAALNSQHIINLNLSLREHLLLNFDHLIIIDDPNIKGDFHAERVMRIRPPIIPIVNLLVGLVHEVV